MEGVSNSATKFTHENAGRPSHLGFDNGPSLLAHSNFSF